jgi:hypothetical protein
MRSKANKLTVLQRSLRHESSQSQSGLVVGNREVNSVNHYSYILVWTCSWKPGGEFSKSLLIYNRTSSCEMVNIMY